VAGCQEWLVTQVFRMEQLQLSYHEERLRKLHVNVPAADRHKRLEQLRKQSFVNVVFPSLLHGTI
jgi:hypothetical protein